MSNLKTLGFNGSQATSLLTSLSSSSSSNNAENKLINWGDSFDVRDENVVWWNNIEKDKRYKHFSPSLRELFRPTYPGSLHSIRRNIHHVLYVVDFSSTDQVKYMDHIFKLIQREVPFRFGLIPAYCSNDTADKGEIKSNAEKMMVYK